MSEDLQLQPLDGEIAVEAVVPEQHPGGELRRLSAVPVELTVEMGRTRMTVGETLELRQGSIITLNRMAGEPVDLLVNGAPIARGEVVVIDEQFGLRVTEMLGDTGREQGGVAPLPAVPEATEGDAQPLT